MQGAFSLPAHALALAAPPLAALGDVLPVVIGVVLSLAGLGVLLMGFVALADRQWRHGSFAVALGALLAAGGLWLVGLFG